LTEAKLELEKKIEGVNQLNDDLDKLAKDHIAKTTMKDKEIMAARE
jgi:hypothetical protein